MTSHKTVQVLVLPSHKLKIDVSCINLLEYRKSYNYKVGLLYIASSLRFPDMTPVMWYTFSVIHCELYNELIM